jgi:hypothetical protein
MVILFHTFIIFRSYVLLCFPTFYIYYLLPLL